MSIFQLYSEYFGLNARPFSLLPDPDYLYWSAGHSRAYAMLEYGLMTFAPITIITGEVGAGKTTLIRYLLRSAPKDLTIGLIANAHGERGKLLHWVCRPLARIMAAGSRTLNGSLSLRRFFDNRRPTDAILFSSSMKLRTFPRKCSRSSDAFPT